MSIYLLIQLISMLAASPLVNTTVLSNVANQLKIKAIL